MSPDELPEYLYLQDVFSNKDFAQRAVSDVTLTLGKLGIKLTSHIIPHDAKSLKKPGDRWPSFIESTNSVDYTRFLRYLLSSEARELLHSETDLKFDNDALSTTYHLMIVHNGEVYPFPRDFTQLAHNYEQTFNKLFRIMRLNAKLVTYATALDPFNRYDPEFEKFIRKYIPDFKGIPTNDFNATRHLLLKHAPWINIEGFSRNAPYLTYAGGFFHFHHSKTGNSYHMGSYVKDSPEYKSAQQVFPQLLKLLGENAGPGDIRWRDTYEQKEYFGYLQSYDMKTFTHSYHLADPYAFLSLLAIYDT
jgi:hypothetical protein